MLKVSSCINNWRLKTRSKYEAERQLESSKLLKTSEKS